MYLSSYQQKDHKNKCLKEMRFVVGMSLGRGLTQLSPAWPGPAQALHKTIFKVGLFMGQVKLFWPNLGPGQKNMAQTQLIGMSLGLARAL